MSAVLAEALPLIGTHEGHWRQEGVGFYPGDLRGVAGLGA